MSGYQKYQVYIPLQFVWEFERRMKQMHEEYMQSNLPNIIDWNYVKEQKETQHED